MQMTDEDVINFMGRDLQPGHLHLCSFTAVNEKMPVVKHEILRGRKPADCRQRATGTEDG
jgi:hypothetical protein